MIEFASQVETLRSACWATREQAQWMRQAMLRWRGFRNDEHGDG